MTRAPLRIAALAGVASLAAVSSAQIPRDPFRFLGPHIRITADELGDIDNGVIVSRTIPADGAELAVFAAGRIDARPGVLADAVRDIERFKRGPFVKAIRRFSDPPTASDLAGLELDDGDLESIRSCRVAACKIKLGAAEILQLGRAIDAAGRNWKPAVQQEFRRLVLARVRAYLSSGHGAIPDYRDHDEPISPAASFAVILHHSTFLGRHLPAVASYLYYFPAARPSEVVHSFLYWSKEQLALKPVIGVSHVVIVQTDGRDGLPQTLVASKQVFGTHYSNASMGVSALFREEGAGYLAYVNRSLVDGIEGLLGPIKRAIVERRMRGEMYKIFVEQRQRLQDR